MKRRIVSDLTVIDLLLMLLLIGGNLALLATGWHL